MSSPLLEVVKLRKNFKMGRHVVPILRNVSFSLAPGEILGIGGESGCGKSTLGKTLLRLIEPNGGSIRFEGQELLSLSKKELQKQRGQMQMIFQNPAASFNPRFRIKDVLAEPFIIHQQSYSTAQLTALLQQVGLESGLLERYPHQLSGGQKQRVAIARALALQPRLIVCDEPFSALDISIQVQIMQLLKSLQEEKGLSYLLISHDLSAMRHFTHRLAIMYLGEIVEIGPTKSVFEQPAHPYTQALLSAIPLPDPSLERQRKPLILKGELPSLTKPISGCPFYSRCPKASLICRDVIPSWKERSGQSEHHVACHLKC